MSSHVLAPVFLAFGAFASVAVASNYLNKTLVLVLLGVLLAVGVALLEQQSESLVEIYNALVKLDDVLKFTLSFVIFLIPTVYSTFVVSEKEEKQPTDRWPASCDTVVEFDVPAKLPEKDKDLFEGFLDR